MDFRVSLSRLLRARFPYIYISTFEEDRVLNEIVSTVSDKELIKNTREVFTWRLTEGISTIDGEIKKDTVEPIKALDFVKNYNQDSVFIFLDFHIFFRDSHQLTNAGVIRKLRDLVAIEDGEKSKNIIFVSPSLILPDELQKDVTTINFDLPSYKEIEDVLNNILESNSSVTVDLHDDKEKLIKAALGLTIHEAENAFALAMVNDGILNSDDIPVVLREKKQLVKKSGILEFVDSNVSIDDVGGLDNLKNWLIKREDSWLDSAKEYNLPSPKGVLITGVPGCGKSLIAKAISSMWGLPLIRLDLSRIFNGLVGSSEENMRRALATAETVSPSILWIDEIEKGFNGLKNSNDGGVSSHIFGIFLTWMQEKEEPVFVIATANNIDQLPPEFLRKGRFDEIFFVDLPTFNERKKIFEVHLSSRLTSPLVKGDFIINDESLNHLAKLTEGFGGAEIEQIVIMSLFEAFSDKRSIKMTDLENSIKNTVALSVTQKEQIIALREWSKLRAVTATSPEDRENTFNSNNNNNNNNSDDKKSNGDNCFDLSSTGYKEAFKDNAPRGGRTLDF
ncbi:MAG: AAA family ATPase [archaeon]|nr:AAA family ATPase [archaeon]